MPELPEVETIARQLQKVIIGKTIKKIEVLRQKSFQGDINLALNKKITSINRVAKVIVIQLENSFPLLLIHLKMTGQLIFTSQKERIFGGHPTLDWIQSLPSKHTRVILTFTDNSVIYFNDIRVFGWIKLVKREEEFQKEIKNIKGIEPLQKDFTFSNFKKALKNTSRPIKLTLLDQSRIAGLGNIYVNDSLFDAGILPTRPTNTLTEKELINLHKSIQKIITLAIKYGGTSQSTYRKLDGMAGSYQDHFIVYRKEGQPCPKCKNTVIKVRLGGRGTYYCPICQK